MKQEPNNAQAIATRSDAAGVPPRPLRTVAGSDAETRSDPTDLGHHWKDPDEYIATLDNGREFPMAENE